MDASSLEELTGLVIDDIAPIHDYLQIFFENGSTLNINNKFETNDASKLGQMKGST
jgi:hypothetical protein